MARLLAALFALVPLVAAQTPLFQVLDNPIPWNASLTDAIGDLDNDGDADLVTRNGVFQNDGHARFAAVAGAPLAFFRLRTTLADVNNDGLLDVLSVDYAAASVRIDLNQGAMIFGGPVAGLPTLANPNDLAAGDVDADGDVDILIGAPSPPLGNNTPVVWLNDGTGSFFAAPPPFTFPSTALPAGRMLLRDLDNDGDLDAVFGGTLSTGIGTPSTGNVTIATNAGGVFTLAAPIWPTFVSDVEIGKFDGDAFPDLVLSSSGPLFIVIRGSATGFLAPVTTAATAYSNPLVAADLNGDGLDELVELSDPYGATSLNVRSVGPTGTVGPPTQSWPSLRLPFFVPGHESARDLDGDGDRDVIAWGWAEPVALMNDGAGALVAIGGRAFGLPSLGGQHACDLDADGDSDVVGWGGWSPGPTSIKTGVNDGAGWFTPGATPLVSFSAGAFSYSLNPFDGDGDGDSDLYVAANPTVYSVPLVDTVLANNGGIFTPVATVTGTGPKSAFVAVDIDLDGDQDIILGRRNARSGPAAVGPMLLLANLGGGGLSAPIPFGSSNHATYDVDVGDFDGNGLPDLFQTNSIVPVAPGQIDPCVLWLNTGAGFSEHVTGFSGSYTAAGDLNGDGRTDLVIDVQVWFSTGTGSLIQGPMLPSPLVGPPSLADVDQDGDLDLIETPATVFFNAGGGNFGPPVSYYPRNSPFGSIESAVVDADRDGDLDILAPGPLVFSNTLRQIARGSIARLGRPASIDLYGTPGGAWFLWASNATAAFSFPPWGTVLIDPASAQLGAMGSFSPTTTTLPGTATFGVTVPNTPALVGWTTYWQAIDAAQMRFTNKITITVMGF